MKYVSFFLKRTRTILCFLMPLCMGFAALNIHAHESVAPYSSSKQNLLARTVAYVKSLVFSKKEQPVHSESLSIRNDLLELVDMCDLDDSLLPHLECFKVFVNGVYVPPETEEVELTDVPHAPHSPCKISVVVPAATLLAILENDQFSQHKQHVSDQIHTYLITRPFINWISNRFGGQRGLVSFLTKYAKAQVIFSYQVDSRDLNRNGQLSILTVIASKKWEWKISPPTIVPRWRPLRTVELVFHDTHIGNL